MVFRDDAWSHADEALALTVVSYDANTGEIRDADIEFNTAQYDFFFGTGQGQGASFLGVATHEAGHVLGFAHSNEVDTVMVSHAAPPIVARELSADDKDGVCNVYPPNGQRLTAAGTIQAAQCALGSGAAAEADPTCPPTTVAQCAYSRPAPGGWSPWVAVVAAVAVLCATRRRCAAGFRG